MMMKNKMKSCYLFNNNNNYNEKTKQIDNWCILFF